MKCGTLASSAFVLVFSGLVLGLGWAVRGVFGHEWGASWAGSMGALGVVVAVNRRDWLRRAPILACLGGVGWGVGGTMSYGLMVASGRGIHFTSVAYGYAMLILVGGLYGFVGGGLFGLGLESGPRNAEWHRLITEMVAFGCLAYVVIIGALEWRMTPPRHESWAACLGASAALGWFLHRGGYHRALRTACYASLGAGIGFSFGNLIQTLNMVIGTGINGWNIMEFLLGFGGGVGMAYAVLSRDWPETITPSRGAHWGALLFLAAGIPVVNRAAAFSMDKFTGAAESLGMVDPAGFAARQLTTASGVVIVMTALVLVYSWRFLSRPKSVAGVAVHGLLFIHAFYFVALSAVKSMVFYTPFSLRNTRLWYLPTLLVIGVIWAIWGRGTPTLPALRPVEETRRRWTLIVAAALILPVVFALVAINTHPFPLEPYYERFGTPHDL